MNDEETEARDHLTTETSDTPSVTVLPSWTNCAGERALSPRGRPDTGLSPSR